MKPTPEFKRAFTHFMDGAGRLGLLNDDDVLYMYGALSKEPCADPDNEEMQGMEAARTHGYRDGLAAAYQASISLLKTQDRELTADTVRGLLDNLNDMMVRAQRAYGARGPRLMPPVWPRLAGSNAERRAMESITADYWHATAREVLGLLRGYEWDGTPNDLGLYELSIWTEQACAYWTVREDMRRHEVADGEARRLYAGYLAVLERDRDARGNELYGAEDGEDFNPYMDFSEAMTAFCAAYSHGVNPYTGRRLRSIIVADAPASARDIRRRVRDNIG